MKVFKNRTNYPQQIHYCDGTAVTVPSLGSVKIDVNRLFGEERIRAAMFFDIVDDIEEADDNSLLIIRRKRVSAQYGPRKSHGGN